MPQFAIITGTVNEDGLLQSAPRLPKARHCFFTEDGFGSPRRASPALRAEAFRPSCRSVFLSVQTFSCLHGEALCLYTGRPCQLCTENASILHEERNASTRRKCQVNTENKAILHEEKTKSPCRGKTVLRVEFAAMRTKKERAGQCPARHFNATKSAAPA